MILEHPGLKLDMVEIIDNKLIVVFPGYKYLIAGWGVRIFYTSS